MLSGTGIGAREAGEKVHAGTTSGPACAVICALRG